MFEDPDTQEKAIVADDTARVTSGMAGDNQAVAIQNNPTLLGRFCNPITDHFFSCSIRSSPGKFYFVCYCLVSMC
jgi:hypothetical protein